MSLFSKVSTFLLVYLFLLCFFPGLMMSSTVTLDSIKIYKTHEWLKRHPTVYFHCKGENQTVLPDVKDVNVSYSFSGDESWQPLVEFFGKKCKRCGFYEKDTLKSDDVFEEWELCPSDFSVSDKKYNRIKEHEYNATFLCLDCVAVKDPVSHATAIVPSKDENNGIELHVVLVVLISASVSVVVLLAIMSTYKYLQRKKREHDQARFLKLFEDGDELEDELGLDNVM